MMADLPHVEPVSPLFSVLIVNYNGIVHLEECLSSLASQDFRDFEVVLVDNASRDGSVEFVRARFPDVRLVLSDSNRGFAGGNNLGLIHCRGSFIFFLNNDTRLMPDTMAQLAGAVGQWTDYSVFACLMLRYHDPRIVDNAGESIYRFGIIQGFSGCPASLFDATREVIAACGGAAVYKRALLDEIGVFEDSFFLLFEDLDLGLRARHHGARVLFLPKARVLHKGSASIGGAGGALGVYYGIRNYFPMLARNFPSITLLKAMPGITLGVCILITQVVRHGQTVPFLRGLRDAVRLMPGALRARRRILGNSKVNRQDFESLMRKGWLRERLALKRKDYRGVP